MRRLLLVLTLAIIAPVAIAQEATTKQEIIERSGPICRDASEAMEPHIAEMNQAYRNERFRKYFRHGRRLIRATRPHARELDELSPQSDGRTRYRRFVNNFESSLDWLAAFLDAYEAGRVRLAERRADNVVAHTTLARRAAKRYGLRRPCIRLVS